MLDAWRVRLERLDERFARTADIRDRLLVKRALVVWKLKLRLVEEVLEPKAVVWHELATKRKALRSWAERFMGSRRAKWESAMRSALERMRKRRERRIVATVFEVCSASFPETDY